MATLSTVSSEGSNASSSSLAPSVQAACPAVFVSAFDLAPGVSEIEIARLVAQFFTEHDEGLQELSVIQGPDGRFSQRLLFDTSARLKQALDSVADRRLGLMKRADALSSGSVMWIGPPSRAPRALWPAAEEEDDENPADGECGDGQLFPHEDGVHTLGSEASGSSYDASPLRAWTERDETVEALKFFSYWNPMTMGDHRRPRRRSQSKPQVRVLFRGVPSAFGGAQYFTKYVQAFSAPQRRLQHLPYNAAPRVPEEHAPLPIEQQSQLPASGRRTLCLAVGLETGATARCLFDTAIVGGAVLPCVGDRLLARVAPTSAATEESGNGAMAPSPPLRSVVVKRVSRWSRKRSGAVDASPVVVERFWSLPLDDEHERQHVFPLASRALQVARQALRKDLLHRNAIRIEAAWSYHDLSAVELRVSLDHVVERGALECVLQDISRKVHEVLGVPVHWLPAVA